jgi:hypothetical protein
MLDHLDILPISYRRVTFSAKSMFFVEVGHDAYELKYIADAIYVPIRVCCMIAIVHLGMASKMNSNDRITANYFSQNNLCSFALLVNIHFYRDDFIALNLFSLIQFFTRRAFFIIRNRPVCFHASADEHTNERTFRLTAPAWSLHQRGLV